MEDTESPVDPVDVVRSFNGAINDRDLEVLAAQMTETHRFIDAAGVTVEGKGACVEAWRGFFVAFPTTATCSRTSPTSATAWSWWAGARSAASPPSTGRPGGRPSWKAGGSTCGT
jgi:SnoaL-like domain